MRVDTTTPASMSDRTNPKTFGNERRGSDEGAVAFSSSDSAALPRHTEVCFFERDLLRSEWTEVLVPVCTSGLQRNAPPGEQHHRAEETVPNLAVVLRVRSAGFAPKDPPLWLLRRDFAERAVARIMSAAAAALVQPRVEMTLLGLSGAVDSLLSERAGEEEPRFGDVMQKTARSVLPAALPGKESNDGCDEVLCEAFWNGALTHKVRLHRAVASSPPAKGESTAVMIPYSSRRGQTSAVGTGGADGIPEGKPVQQTVGLLSPSEPASAAASGESDKKQRVEGAVVSPAGVRPAHPRGSGSPSTWFSDDRGGDGDDPLGSDWVTLSGGEFPSRNDPAERREASGEQQPAVAVVPRTAGEARRKVSRQQLSGTTDAGEEATRQPLVWVPAEGDVFGGRPFRFFFPACPLDDAAGGQAGDTYAGEVDGQGENSGGTGFEGEVTGDSSSGDGDAGNTRDNNIRGDLRLVFWAISSSSSSAAQERKSPNIECVGETDISTAMMVKQKATGKDGRVPAAATAAAAPHRQRGGGTGRKMLGWAALADDELLLQPRGHRIELALSAKSGLDAHTVWSMAHDLERYAAYREW